MRIDIVTLFPEMFKGPFEQSIVKRAQDKSLVNINIYNLRQWAIDKRGTVDDKPYSGGVGMVLRPEPIFQAVENIKKQWNNETTRLQSPEATADGGQVKQSKVVLLSASGTSYTQQKAHEFSKINHLILICGHYEGVDQRVADHLCNEEISIGDYVLTGGEIPAMVIADSVVRLIPGVLEKPEATTNESFSFARRSFSEGGLEHPQYTRPENFKGYKVPSILLSGNHAKIEKWKKEKALERTRRLRPDLLI